MLHWSIWDFREMAGKIDLTGQTFGALTVIKRAGNDRYNESATAPAAKSTSGRALTSAKTTRKPVAAAQKQTWGEALT
jgi:hypothetical protein